MPQSRRHQRSHLGLAFVAASLALALAGLTPGAATVVRAAATAPKAVVIVGPMEANTAGNIQEADDLSVAATTVGFTVVKVYSPNATWANVSAAMQGASLVVYMGHGNGFPSPYGSTLYPDRTDGMMLDPGPGCVTGTSYAYCGESTIAANIRLAPNSLVLLEHLCYATGDSEPRFGQPDLAIAMQRVDNYATGFLAAGAGAVLGYGVQPVSMVVSALATPGLTIDQVFRNTGFQGVSDITFPSSRTPGANIHMDPLATPLSNGQTYYRALAGNLDLRTNDILAGGNDPDRWFGPDRYATAAAVAGAAFPHGSSVVYVATGTSFPDALAGAAAAGHRHAPVLLTASDTLPTVTIAALQALRPTTIYVLGGMGAISQDVATQLAQYARNVIRLGGADRYQTAALTGLDAFPNGSATVYVATGTNFPDALAGAAAASSVGAPILLVEPTSLPEATATALDALQPTTIVLLGGASVVSSEVFAALQAHAPTVTRLSGADRYATAVAIARATWTSAPTVYVATGLNFPDALAGAPLGGPLMLVPGTTVPDVVRAAVVALHPSRIVALGGYGVVSASVMSDLRAAAGLP